MIFRVSVLCLMLSLAGVVFANGGSGYEAVLSFSHIGDDCRNIPDDEYIVSISAHHPTRSIDAQVWFFGAIEPLFSFRIEGDKVFWPSYTTSNDPDGEVILDDKNGTVVNYKVGVGDDYSIVRIAFILADDGSMTIVGEEKRNNKDCVVNFIGSAD